MNRLAVDRLFEMTGRALPWLALALLWLVIVQYRGLVHDAVLYSLQALAHRYPQLYSNDVFLRFGSQDRFTLFTPFYGWWIGWVGLEPAAMLLTFVALALLLGAAAWLCHRMTSGALTLAGVALLLGMPDDYGPSGIFHVLEYFLTPRLFAEAASLAAIAAAVSGRRVAAGLLVALGVIVHPLMAAPALLVVGLLWPSRNATRGLTAAIVAGILALAVGGSLPALDGYRIDDAWRLALDLHAPYLFLANWTPADWVRAATTALTMTLGLQFAERATMRRVCGASLLVALAGILITAIGADWLKLALVAQGQGYRWLWPMSLLAPLCLPALAVDLWNRGSGARAVLFALGASWLYRSEALAPLFLFLTLLLAILEARGSLSARNGRWALTFATLLFAIASVSSLSMIALSNTSAYEDSFAPVEVNRIRNFMSDGLVPAVLVLVCATVAAQRHRALVGGLAFALLIAIAAMIGPNIDSWRRRLYDPKVVAAYSSWRALIPRRVEVAWVESPLSVWVLLERPSYFSVHQTGSVVFSRRAALELVDREKGLIPYLLGSGLAAPNDATRLLMGASPPVARTLLEVCAHMRAPFIVSRADLHARPIAAAPAGAPTGLRQARLYQCDNPSSPSDPGNT